MKKLLIVFLSIFLIFLNVFADDDIQVVLEQPAVSMAKSGENLLYNLTIKLPNNYDKKYESFSVTLLMDANLKVKSTELLGAQAKSGKINLKTTENSKTGQNIVTLNVDDISIIKNPNLGIKINTEVKEEIKSGENLENSFVLSYLDKKGDTSSNQKNFESSTKAQNIDLKVEDIFTNSKTVKGKSEKNSTIILYKGSKEIKRTKANDDGSFILNIDPQKEGDLIRIYSFVGKESVYVDAIVKAAADSSKAEEVKKVDDKKEIIKTIGNIKKLSDYVAFAKDLPTGKSTKEEEARLKAAIASGEYLQVKKEVKDMEIYKTLNELEESIKSVRKPYMVGSGDKFHPDRGMKRAEVAAVLSKITMGDKTINDFSSFKDVDEGKWYANAVASVEEKKLISGYSDGSFKPNKEIKRSEFAMIIYNYLKLEENYNEVDFTDLAKNHWAKKAIDALASNGIMVGTDAKHFNPDGKLKRCQAAVIINKILDRKVNEDFLRIYGKNPYTDLSKDHWAYYQILEVSGM